MTSDTSIDVREVIFINPGAESGYEALPIGVSEEADGALTTLQNGQVPARKGVWRMLKGKLGGVGEIRINDSTNTYRIYVWLGCEPALYVLDAGMKKSPTGSEIPQWQQDRLVARRERAAQDCADIRADLDQAFGDRAMQRQRRKQEVAR
ncbi:MAG: type II toxin-antitoxin system RelE/ParE family toxin [Janthinobacterium lividum]